MTKENKIKVIAEAFDFKNVENGVGERVDGFGYFTIPDYLHSYDAILPVIVKWCNEDLGRWQTFVYNLITTHNLDEGSRPCYVVQWTFQLSAEKLSDALIHAMGKWEES